MQIARTEKTAHESCEQQLVKQHVGYRTIYHYLHPLWYKMHETINYQQRYFVLTYLHTCTPATIFVIHAFIRIYIIKRIVCLSVCPLLPWPYLWTDFDTKGTYGLPMTQGWLEKYKILNFRKIKKMKNFPPWMPLQTRRASLGRRRRPCSEYF